MNTTTTTAKTLDEIPNPAEDLTGCLDTLAGIMGDEWVFQLIGKIRDHRGPGEAGTVRSRLARDMVDAEMRATGADENQAINTVGERLGYTPFRRRPDGTAENGVANFAKIVRGTTRTGKEING